MCLPIFAGQCLHYPIDSNCSWKSEFFFGCFLVHGFLAPQKMNRPKSNKPCIFCEDATENPVEMGEMLTYKTIRAHNYCLVSRLFSFFVCLFVQFSCVLCWFHVNLLQTNWVHMNDFVCSLSFADAQLGLDTAGWRWWRDQWISPSRHKHRVGKGR